MQNFSIGKVSPFIRCQSNLVSVSRSNFYYHQVGETTENLRIMHLRDEHYLNILERIRRLAFCV